MRHFFHATVLLWLFAARALAGDGVWTFHERYCLTLDGTRGCGRGSEDFMFYQGVAYYRPDAGEYWTEVGTVTTTRKHFLVNVTREGVGRLVANRIGVDASDLLRDFALTYRGSIAGNRILAGRGRVKLVIDVGDEVHRVKGNVRFMGRRLGDAYPAPPPDPYYYGFEASRRAAEAGPAALAAVRGLVNDVAR